MTKLLAIAALLLASTAAAQAQYTFDYGGRTIRIDPDRGTVSIPGVYDNTGEPPRRAKRETGEHKRKPAPAQDARSDPQGVPATSSPPTAAPAPAATGPEAVPAASPSAATPPANATVAVTPPADSAATTPQPAPPVQQQEAAPPAPTVAAAPPAAAPKPAPNPVQAANSPLGVWLTEEKEGKVRIEQCGANLCGYAVDKKTSQNREQILINMKPGKDKWSGRIVDPNSGSTYDSTIALKGSDTLRVQGCAFGGMFCGGQTWTRVN
ncbi:DUF2147 domain-containing protein [Bradyrhizobium genosp. L]|uniref:DUF2147 domain-containing protein n=1 Tax=Bradyrhizobium genosp. L TaxID=83637 RepID=UPI0018A2FB2E|nr:DUF2147 domain-containing protein [Bradyrhizobium genosp. L]QPF81819.1 DUF2147 domain-containing protein [Bradyrhizobium genosp. L]